MRKSVTKNQPLTLTESVITTLLANKHSEDVFVPQCKTGRSGIYCHIMDAWAMKRSWTSRCCTGYEIKVSRGDFLDDYKWFSYLPFCNCLYWVCPSGLIDPSEVAESTGLMWVSKTGTRLYTKKKAPHRDVVIDNDIFYYILMWRARVTRENAGQDATQYWRQWLDNKRDDQALGYEVSRKIQQLYSDNVTKVKTENRRLAREIKALRDVQKMLKKLGVEPRGYNCVDRVKQALCDVYSPEILEALEDVKTATDQALALAKKGTPKTLLTHSSRLSSM